MLGYVRRDPPSPKRQASDTYTWDIVFWCVFLSILVPLLVLALLAQ